MAVIALGAPTGLVNNPSAGTDLSAVVDAKAKQARDFSWQIVRQSGSDRMRSAGRYRSRFLRGTDC
jgi:hypothetical protein